MFVLDGNPCADRLFEVVDVDGSGGISFKEGCQGIANRRTMSTKEAKFHGIIDIREKNKIKSLLPLRYL